MSFLNKKISIVIPVYNGENSIANLVDQLINKLGEKQELEIVLINDNSPDKSEYACRKAFEKHPDIVRFFSLAKNVGEHNAVMAGLKKSSGDIAVIVDDDFQNPISEIYKLINYSLKNDYDVVYTYYKKKKHNFFRNIGSKFNDKVANLMLKKPKDLYMSSFKVLNRFIIDEIVKYDLPFPYIDGLILRTTDKIGKILVEHKEREMGSSGYTLTKLIRLWLNMFTSFSILPLRIATILGVIFSFFGLIFGIVTVVEKLSDPTIPIGYTTIIVIVLIFAGIQLLSLGMIGEYVGRVFMAMNKKPQYTIRRSFEKKENR